jgi:hypothetical protein
MIGIELGGNETLLSKITPRSVSAPRAKAGEHKRPRLTAAAPVKENEFICVNPRNEPSRHSFAHRVGKTMPRPTRSRLAGAARGESYLITVYARGSRGHGARAATGRPRQDAQLRTRARRMDRRLENAEIGGRDLVGWTVIEQNPEHCHPKRHPVAIIADPAVPRISAKKTGATPKRQISRHRTSSSLQNANRKSTTTVGSISKR